MRTPPRSTSSKDRDTTCTRGRSGGSAYRRLSGAERRRDRGSDRSSGEASPALGPAALQHGAAGAGRHPGAEAVALGSPVVVGLECALHEILLGRSGVLAEPVAVACYKTWCARTRQSARCDLARLSGDRGRATTGVRGPRRRSWRTFWQADGSCYGPAPATWRPSCPHLWTSVWTFARRAFQRRSKERVDERFRVCDRRRSGRKDTGAPAAVGDVQVSRGMEDGR